MKEPVKALAGIIIAGLVALGLVSPIAAASAQEVKLTVRVFRIPREQSFDAVLLDGKGRPAIFQACGDVTSSFPRATVFFPTELAASASTGAISDAILDRVTFGVGSVPAKSIRVEELKSLELALDGNKPDAEARFEESRGEGRSSNYEVRAQFLSSANGKVLVRLRFDAGWSAQAGSLGVGMSEDVISAPVELSESKLFLIGAPSSRMGGSSSGAVYWLAVSAAPASSAPPVAGRL
jgi:hypothetical protein